MHPTIHNGYSLWQPFEHSNSWNTLGLLIYVLSDTRDCIFFCIVAENLFTAIKD